MRYDSQFIAELKSRLRLSDVIGRTVKLRRQGREYVGLSPFNKEKSPSFFVNDDKGFYHDFSSGKHGDLISFLQETQRLSFPEAVERLAGEAGLALPLPDPTTARIDQQRAELQAWLEQASRWFEAQLCARVGAAARAYLDARGISEDVRARFRLGYAPPGWTALKDHLIAKGANASLLVEAGLLIQPQGGRAPYDRFRDRIIFPISDRSGRLVSFGGRALGPEAPAKYLNGPETTVFSKSRTLYGLAEARQLLRTSALARPGSGDGEPALVVVEGYLDVIACQRAGIAAVAPLGTALTEDQMELLWRRHDEPILCFDNDDAGRRAASRALERALPLLKPGRSFRFVWLTGGKDADDVLREHGAEVLRGQLADTRPFVDVVFEREAIAQPLSTPESYAGLQARLKTLAGSILDRDLSHLYREALLERFDQLRRSQRPDAVGRFHRRSTFGPARTTELTASLAARKVQPPDAPPPELEQLRAAINQAKAEGDFAALVQLKRERDGVVRASRA